jgi:ABC-2 type transport system permease protein
MPPRIQAILLAQWQSFCHYRPAGGQAGRILAAVLWMTWYAMWTFLGVALCVWVAVARPSSLALNLPLIFAGVCLFWQVAPILTAQAGASLEFKKLILYPIPQGELFAVELLLRLATAAEMLLILLGTLCGLLLNPAVPVGGAALALALFLFFNLFLSTGLRSLLERLLSIRFVREIAVLVMVLIAALPQVLSYTGVSPGMRRLAIQHQSEALPWAAAARIALGETPLPALASLAVWTAAALLFAWSQLRRSLRFDATAARASRPRSPARARRLDLLYRLPASFFPDPLAVMIEKELRSLARTPRFRIVFFMGFSFGAILWWPLLHGIGRLTAFGLSYPVVVTAYAMLLLAEVACWNQFGFDRAATQLYFSAPVSFSQVLRAKNVAGMSFVALEITLVLAVCLALRVPLPLSQIVEAVAVTGVFSLYFLATGNLSSVYFPRPVNPEHSWGRAATGRLQLYMLLLFPVLLGPVAAAYGAQYALHSRAVFFAVLAVDAVLGVAAYLMATRIAVAAAAGRQELFLSTLSQSPGPIQ